MVNAKLPATGGESCTCMGGCGLAVPGTRHMFVVSPALRNPHMVEIDADARQRILLVAWIVIVYFTPAWDRQFTVISISYDSAGCGTSFGVKLVHLYLLTT